MNTIRFSLSLACWALASLWLPTAASAQTEPCFTVEPMVGCSGLVVQVTPCGGVITPVYAYRYDPSLSIEDNVWVPNRSNTVPYIIIDENTTDTTILVAQLVGSEVLAQEITVYRPLRPEVDVSLCNSREVLVDLTDSYYDGYAIDYGDGDEQTVTAGQFIHQYPAEGNYDLVIQGFFTDANGVNGSPTCGRATFAIEPVETLPAPRITQLTLEDLTEEGEGSVTLEYEANANLDYTLERRTDGGAFETIGELDPTANSTAETLTGLDAQAYCYRIALTSACNGAVTYSNIVCAQTLNGEALGGLSNRLTWPAYSGPALNRYEITTEGGETFARSAGSTAFTDNAADCEETYRLTAILNTGARSTSNPVYLEQRPEAPAGVYASVEGGSARLLFETPADGAVIDRLEAVRTGDGGELTLTGAPASPFMDSDANVDSLSYCYSARYVDACGQPTAFTEQTCTMLASVVQTPGFNTVSWNAFVGFDARYVVEVSDENFNVLRTESAPQGQLELADPSDQELNALLYYRVRAVELGGGDRVSYSNYVEVPRFAPVQIPDGFTPNGDGLNDTFVVRGVITDYLVEVYNRQGALVFRSTDAQRQWDGTVNGRSVPDGPYTYRVEGKDTFGRPVKKAGMVLLVR